MEETLSGSSRPKDKNQFSVKFLDLSLHPQTKEVELKFRVRIGECQKEVGKLISKISEEPRSFLQTAG